MREDKGKLDLVRYGISVAPSLNRDAESRGSGPKGGPGETKRVHCAVD